MNLRPLGWSTLLMFAVGLTSACGGDDTTDDSGTTETDTDTDTATAPDPAPPASADIQAIADVSCAGAGCHNPGTSGGLDLSTVYASTVGVSSGYTATESGAELDYVKPSAPGDSYLFLKLEGTYGELTDGGGAQMPKGGTLSGEDLDTVRTWIEGGAVE